MGQCRSPSVSPSRQLGAPSSSSCGATPPDLLSLFQQYVQDGNPFEMHAEHREEETEDVLASNGVSVKAASVTSSVFRNSLLPDVESIKFLCFAPSFYN